MANYTFETTSQAQAAGFTAADYLIFQNTSTNAVNLTVTPASATGLNNASITLSNGTQSLTFPASTLATASQNNHLVFNDQSSLILGTTNADTGGAFNGTTANDVIYGFGGNDNIAGGNGNDYIYGGTDTGANATAAQVGPPAVPAVPTAFGDTLDGGDGNDHIYGNSYTTVAGQADGPDSILGGNGADYIQGNAGEDSIDGGNGSDRIFGGADNDTILGGAGNDTINGNLGNDSIDGGADNDFIRGGQGNDIILGNTGDDVLLGDLGNDTITGGTGFDAIAGGSGNDLFVFTGQDANFNLTAGGATGPQTNGAYNGGATSVATDQITDFQDGSDLVRLFGAGATTVVLHANGAASSMAQAQLIAQGLITQAGTANDVAAVTVGSDTYLFYNAAGTASSQIDSAIKVLNVNDAQFTAVDFG